MFIYLFIFLTIWLQAPDGCIQASWVADVAILPLSGVSTLFIFPCMCFSSFCLSPVSTDETDSRSGARPRRNTQVFFGWDAAFLWADCTSDGLWMMPCAGPHLASRAETRWVERRWLTSGFLHFTNSIKDEKAFPGPRLGMDLCDGHPLTLSPMLRAGTQDNST